MPRLYNPFYLITLTIFSEEQMIKFLIIQFSSSSSYMLSVSSKYTSLSKHPQSV
jgi:hypothetical protein